MASSFSDLLRYEKMADGENDDTWGQILNTQVELLEDAIAGRATITGLGATDRTLTTANGATDEARMVVLDLTGALTANIAIIVPTSTKFYIVENSTTNAFTVTVRTSAGTGIVVEQNRALLLYCDGTNVLEVNAEPPGDVARATAATLADDSTLFGALAVTAFARLAVGSSFTAGQAVTSVSLTDGANIATDAALGNYFRVTLAGNRTLDNPTNLLDGQALVYKILQDATGSRTLAYGSIFRFPAGTAPVLTTTANATDLITCLYDSTDNELLCSFQLNES